MSHTKEDPGYVPYDATDDKYGGAWKVVNEEFDKIKQRRANAEKDNLSGLALSGGGIRSASFCLGVMQALASKSKLQNFDYLSTVSGGGYIGGALSWLWLGKWKNGKPSKKFDTSKDNFPYGSGTRHSNPDKAMDTDQAKLMRHLRQNGKYLTPGNGLTIWSLLSVVLRGITMGFVTLLALTSLFFHLLYYTPVFEQGFLSKTLILDLGFGGILFYLAALLLYGIFAVFFQRSHPAYLLRRRWEKVIARIFIAAVLLLSLALVHELTVLVSDKIEASGSLPALLGAIIAWYSQKSSKVNFFKFIPKSFLVYLGIIMMFFGLFVLAEQIALQMMRVNGVIAGYNAGLVYHLIVGLVVIVSAYLIPINKVSIHRYYRDRLMETFNPDVEEVLARSKYDTVVLASKANKTGMHECLADENNNMPYHIINTNIILVESKIPKVKGRGGDNFILTPLYSGSNATGWRKSEEFAGGSITLPSAVAISGAAANANAGVAGSGLTMNPLISVLMSIFNLRLGYWTMNPQLKNKNLLAKDQSTNPNYLNPGIRGILGLETLSEDADFIQLSDGGHFENLAVYELLRRHCRLIVCCDAEQDSDFVFASLSNLIEKARVDFGVKIEIAEEDLAKLKYEQNSNGEIKFADQGYITADIIYPHGEAVGKLVYIKTTLPKGLPADVMGYKYTHNAFPDETTADQFFDEKQMEAYRMLGMNIAETMIDKGVL